MIAVTATLALCPCVVAAAPVGSEDTGIGAHVRAGTWPAAAAAKTRTVGSAALARSDWLFGDARQRLDYRRFATAASGRLLT